MAKAAVKKTGAGIEVKEIAADGVIKAVKKIIKPGVFGNVDSAEIATLASAGEKVVLYFTKSQNLKKEIYNFALQKEPLKNVYGTAVLVRVKAGSADTVQAVDLTDDDIKAFEKILK